MQKRGKIRKKLSFNWLFKDRYLCIFKKKIAFSLVELMISLITISCIAAAFAPVITKRLSSNSAAVRNQTQVLSDCSRIAPDGKCSLCYPGECIVCDRKCQPNQYLNVKNCICENCFERTEDGQCTSCVEEHCYGCAAGFYCENHDCTSCTPCPMQYDDGTCDGPYETCVNACAEERTSCTQQQSRCQVGGYGTPSYDCFQSRYSCTTDCQTIYGSCGTSCYIAYNNCSNQCQNASCQCNCSSYGCYTCYGSSCSNYNSCTNNCSTKKTSCYNTCSSNYTKCTDKCPTSDYCKSFCDGYYNCDDDYNACVDACAGTYNECMEANPSACCPEGTDRPVPCQKDFIN